MRSALHRILFLLLLPALFSCAGTDSRDHTLSEIAQILESNPGEALSRLKGIDSSSLKEERDLAYYALLRTQAEYKCYITPQTDSLIRIATAYYGEKKKSLQAAMSWYSLGCVYSEWQDDARAVDAYL